MDDVVSSIDLPVSLGEALDKLSILDIKLDKIKDERKKDVEKEYNILYENLKIHVDKFNFYYRILKKINLDIWEMQDDFRYNNGNKTQLCMKIIEDNDRRFRAKKKINDLTCSNLKEQKGYKSKKAFVLTHLGLGDNITAIGMIRYLSTAYDEVKVICKTNNYKNVELFYSDDPNIIVVPVENDYCVSPRYGFDMNTFINNTRGYKVYACGFHNIQNIQWNDASIPFCFYEQLKLSPQIFWDYFYIPKFNKGEELYKKVKNIDYVFVHNSSSQGEVFTINFVESKINKNRNEILFINPNVNCYNENDKYFSLAKEFIGHKLPYYVDVIKNAQYNLFSDSSFMCMAINLEIKNDNNFYISRNKMSYPIYDPKYKFKNVNRKIFKHLQ